jgi:hypothetical protein
MAYFGSMEIARSKSRIAGAFKSRSRLSILSQPSMYARYASRLVVSRRPTRAVSGAVVTPSFARKDADDAVLQCEDVLEEPVDLGVGQHVTSFEIDQTGRHPQVLAAALESASHHQLRAEGGADLLQGAARAPHRFQDTPPIHDTEAIERRQIARHRFRDTGAKPATSGSADRFAKSMTASAGRSLVLVWTSHGRRRCWRSRRLAGCDRARLHGRDESIPAPGDGADERSATPPRRRDFREGRKSPAPSHFSVTLAPGQTPSSSSSFGHELARAVEQEEQQIEQLGREIQRFAAARHPIRDAVGLEVPKRKRMVRNCSRKIPSCD